MSRAENIDYLALKTQTVHPPGTERAHSSDAWLAVSTPHAPGPERLREAPGPQEWEPSQCGSTSWKSGQRGTPWTPKETEDPDCSSPFCQRWSDTLGYPPPQVSPQAAYTESQEFPALAPIQSPPTLCTPSPLQSRGMCEGDRCHPQEKTRSKSSRGVAGWLRDPKVLEELP